MPDQRRKCLITVYEIKEKKNELAEAADSLGTFHKAMKSLEEPRLQGNIFAEAESKLYPQGYAVNYGKEVLVEKPKSDLAKAFENFFTDPSDLIAPPKKTPKTMNELSCMADEIIHGEIHHSGNH